MEFEQRPEYLTPHYLKLGFLVSHNTDTVEAVINAIKSGVMDVGVAALISNSPESAPLEFAKNYKFPSTHINTTTNPNDEFETIAGEFRMRDANLIIATDYEKCIAKPLVDAYPNRILVSKPTIYEEFMEGRWTNSRIGGSYQK